MGDMLNAGVKIHDYVASKVANMPYDEFLKARKAGDKRLGNIRQAAKPIDFGVPGGMGVAKMVIQQRVQGPNTACVNGPSEIRDGVMGYRGLRFCILAGGETSCGINMVTSWKGRGLPSPVCVRCIEEAQKIKNVFMDTFPENTEYLGVYIKNLIETEGRIVQHGVKRLRGGVDFCSAANGYFQGLLADATKDALYRVTKEQYTDPSSDLFGSRGIGFLHDELLGECDESRGHQVANRVSAIMVEELQKYCPDLKDACFAEPTLMRRWYKGAEPTYDQDGKLIPWEPKNG
jgi:DNA polymerase-1